MFRDLDEKETKKFQQWAKDNYKVGQDINAGWYPVVQAEAVKMNAEAGAKGLY